jgi:hypothetical protein
VLVVGAKGEILGIVSEENDNLVIRTADIFRMDLMRLENWEAPIALTSHNPLYQIVGHSLGGPLCLGRAPSKTNRAASLRVGA